MASSLEDIKRPIKSDLQTFEKKFKESMKSDVPLLDRVTGYIVNRKGKQIRPIIVFLTANLQGETNEATHTAASLIELLHTATLVHDDVVDDSDKRRGFFSINALWKNKIAVLVGDFLLSRGLLVSVQKEQYRLLQVMAEAVQAMSEGELLQMEKARKLDIEEDVYFDIIEKKTASLISSACAAGMSSVTNDEEIIQKAKKMGDLIGIAFQIKDDLFDYGEREIGKPRGIDIKERKMTLPLIYAMSQSDEKKKREIINTIKNHNRDNKKVKEIIEYVKSKGGIEYTQERMLEYRDKAKEVLYEFPKSEVRDSFELLIDFTINRRV